jgi:hypothetical protein
VKWKPPIENERKMTYEEAREHIEDADIFMFRGDYKSSKLFRLVDRSYYSHAALALWWRKRLMILQAEGPGIQAVPMSIAVGTYPGRVDWYRLKRDLVPDFEDKLRKLANEAKADLGLPYGVKDLWRNVMRWLTKVKLKDPMSPHAMYCSEYVERCFRVGGMPLSDRPDIITMPKHIAESPLITYHATIPHNPKVKEKRSIDDIRAARLAAAAS